MSITTPVAHVMTTKVRTVDVEDSLSTVRHAFAEGSIHHLPVLEGEILVGIISSRDLVRVYKEMSYSGTTGIDEKLDQVASIKEIMNTDLVTMRPGENVDRAIDLLADGSVHSVLVVDENENLIGIMTNIDILEYLFA